MKLISFKEKTFELDFPKLGIGYQAMEKVYFMHKNALLYKQLSKYNLSSAHETAKREDRETKISELVRFLLVYSLPDLENLSVLFNCYL